MGRASSGVTVDIGFKVQLNDLFKDLKGPLGKLSDLVEGSGLSDAIKDEVKSANTELETLYEDLSNKYDELLNGKIDNSSFDAFKKTTQNRLSELANQINDLTQRFNDFQTAMSGVDASAAGRGVIELSQKFTEFREQVLGANQLLQEFMNIADKRNQPIQFIDSTDMRNAINQSKALTDILDNFGAGEVETRSEKTADEVRAAIAEADKQLGDIESRYYDAIDANNNEKIVESTKQLFDQIDVINVLIEKYEELTGKKYDFAELPVFKSDEMSKSGFAKNITKKWDEYISDITQQTINRRDLINSTIQDNAQKSESFADVEQFAIKNGSISVPLKISTTASGLKSEVNGILDAVQSSIKPIEVKFKLTSGYNKYRTDELKEAQNLENQINELDIPNETKQNLLNLTSNIREAFGKELKINIRENSADVANTIKSNIKNLQSELNSQPIEIKLKVDDASKKQVVKDIIETKNGGNKKDETHPEKLPQLMANMSQYMNAQNDVKGNGFWEYLQKNLENADGAAKKLLISLGLISKEDNQINTINNGGTNRGGIVGPENTVIARSGTTEKYEDAIKLKDALNQASEAGVQCSRILNVVFDKNTGMILELQKTMSGEPISNIGLFGEEKDLKFNEAILKATDEQILKLITDLETLNKLGINVDFNDSNFLFDEKNGFSFLDLGLKDANSSDFGLPDFTEMLDYISDSFENPKITSAIENFKTRLMSINDMRQTGGENSATETANSATTAIETATEAITKEGQAATEATPSLQEFAKANIEIQKSADLVSEALEKVASIYQSLSSLDFVKLINKEQLNDVVIDLEKVMESMQDIFKQFGDKGLSTALTKLTKDQIKNIITDNNLNTTQQGLSKLRKDELVGVAIEGFKNVNPTQQQVDNALNEQLNSLIGIIEKVESAFMEEAQIVDTAMNMNVSSIDKVISSLGEFSDWLHLLIDEVQQLQKDNPDFLLPINNILDKTEELKNLATIINESKEKINQAAEKVGVEKPSQEDLNVPAVQSMATGFDNATDSVNNFGQTAQKQLEQVEHLEGEIVDDAIAINNAFRQGKETYGRTGNWNEAYEDMMSRFKSNFERGGFKYQSSSIKVSPDFSEFRGGTSSWYNDELKQGVVYSFKYNKELGEIAQTQIQINDSNKARIQDIEQTIKKVAELKEALAGIEATNKGLDISEQVQNIDDLIFKFANGTTSINEVENAINNLKTSISSIKGDLKGGGSSLNEVTNAVNLIRNAENDLTSFRLDIDDLIDPPDKIKEELLQLRELLDEIQSYDIDKNGINKESSSKIKDYIQLRSQIQNELKIAKRENANQLVVDSFRPKLEAISPTYQSQFVNEYEELVSRIDTLNKEFLEGTDGVRLGVNEYKRLMNEAFTTWSKETRVGIGKSLGTNIVDVDAAKSLAQEYIGQFKTVKKELQFSDTPTADGLYKFTAQVRDAEGVVQNLSFVYDSEFQKMAVSTKNVGTELTGFPALFDNLKGKVQQLATYWTARLFDPYRMIGNIKKVISVVKEYDSAMMEIRKVSQASAEEFNNIKMNSFDVGKQIGATGKDVLSSVAAWKRLGKSLEESQEAAKASNWLLNVSEFTNIDDATKSLVSMTQAFDDLSYESAIDKLNGVGDAFSSSTDQIASGMQNVSSVLQVAGNNVDQSIALLAAANDVTQDMSKASMGVRTIALRIAGTQDAKQQLEDMGEDTSDFVVQTMSKVDQKVRNYTKTAATPNGISVLDDNGRLRDTYSILLDIAKVWDDIVAKDNEFGTNTSNALLELLAGKTRSNVLASILQAPEILESAYETSKNSAGVGQRELDVYMDSIQAKTIQLTNSLQELANISINSESLKTLLDIINALLNGVNSLAKQFGVLNTVVGGVASFALQKKGFGFFSYDKKNGFSTILSRMTEASKEASIQIPRNFDKIITAVNKNTTESGRQNKLVNWDGFFTQHGVEDRNLQSFLQDTSFPTKDLQNYISYMDQAQASTSRFGAVLTNLKSIGTNALSMLATQAAVMVAMWAAGEIIKGVDQWIHRNEIAIKKGKEATQSIQDQYKAYQELNDQLKEMGKSDSGEEIANTKEAIGAIAEKYSELHDGVNELTNANESLSTEKYQEYLDISNQIAEQFPSLVSGYDDEGNAILNVGSSATQAEQALMRMYEASKLASNVEISQNLQDSYTGIATQIKEYETKNTDLATDISNLEKDIAENEKEQNNVNNGEWARIEGNTIVIPSYSTDKESKIRKLLIDSYNDITLDDMGQLFEPGKEAKFVMSNVDESLIPSIQQSISALVKSSVEATGAALQAEINTKEQQMQSNNLYIADQKKAITNVVSQYLNTSDIFDEQSELLQNALLSNLDKLDYELISSKYGGQIVPFIYGEIIGPLNNLTPEIQKALDDAIETSSKNISASDYYQQIMDGLQEAFGHNQAEVKRWSDYIGLGSLFEEINAAQNNVLNEFGLSRTNTDDSTVQAILGLNLEDLRAYADLVKDGVYKTWEDLQKAFNEKKRTKEIKPDGTLSFIFNDESYSSAVEGFEKHLSSLTGALETIRTEGKLTAEQMRDLQEEFPDLTDFSEKAIGDATLKELTGWIDEFKKHIDTLSPEGMEQLQTYVENLTMSFGDLGVNAEEAMKAVYDSMIDPNASLGKQQGQSAQAKTMFDDLISQIKSEGGEVNYQVIWELAMMDRFSDPAANIYEEYKDKEFQWEVNISYNETIAQIEKEIEGRSARKSSIEARNAYTDATGNVVPDTEASKKYFNKMNQEYEEAAREYGKNSKEAQDAKKAMNAAYEEMAKSDEISFEETLALDQADIDARYEEYMTRKKAYNNLEDAEKTVDSSEYKAMEEARTAYYQSLTTQAQDQQAIDEYGIKDYTKAIENSQTQATNLQNQIDKTKNAGQRVSRDVYESLANEYIEQAKQQESIAEYWDTIAEDTTRNIVDRATAAKKAAEARSQAIDFRKQSDESGRQYDIDQLTEYQNAYTDFQNEAAQTEDELNAADQKHLKTSEKLYNNLIKNGNDQIKNLNSQKQALKNLLATTKEGTNEWRDYQSQINDVDKSIEQMQLNQLAWEETAQSLVSTNASELASILSSAMSEMNSETGLTIDTMNELQRQFSDLAGYDVSNIFYQSADGMKMNTSAAETLVEAEYKLQTNNLYEAIDQQRNIIELLGNSEDESAQKAVAAAEQRIDAYNRELSMLQALYDQQKDQFSNYQKWQNAQQTENAGARYENLQGYMETATKAYDQGMTGTDDFRSYVQYFDKWGLDTVEAYERNIEKMKRYLTDDYTGVKNFYDDLIKNGFGTEENGIYDIEMTNVEEAAKTMGMSSEWLKDMMSRGEDYGFTNDWVESELDGRMKLQDLMQKQIDAQKKVNELEREGAPQEVIKEAQDVLDTYQNSAKNVAENIQDVIANDGKISATQIQGAVENINSYREMLKDVQQQYGLGNIDAETATGQIQLIHDNIEAEAAQWHIPLDGFEVDTDALNKQFEGWDAEVSVTPKWENIEGIDDSTIGQSFYDTSEKLKTGWDENQTSLQENISSLQKLGLTYEELKGINLDDHKYDDEDNASLIAAEQTLDNIKTTLGLNVEEATQLVEVLSQLGLLEAPDLEFNIPTSVEDLSKQNRTAYAEELPIEIQQELAKQAAYRENADMYAPISDSITGASEEIVSAIGAGAETISSSIDKNETGESQDIKQTENISGAGLDSSDITVHGQMIADQQYAQSNVETNQSGVIVNLDNQAFNAQIEAAMQKIDDLNNKSANPTVNLDGQAFIAQIDAANQKLDELNSKQINPTANIDGSQFVNQANAASDKLNSLAGNSVSTSINLDGSSFVKSANAAQDKLDSLGGATASPTLDANNASLVSKTDDARARITALDGMSANPSVNVTGNASSMISSIESSLNSLNGREVVTRIVTEHVDRKGSGLGGINNNVALAGGNAFAGGKDNSEEVPFNYNGGTLVGEEAPEMHVSRDGGYWQLVGQNGPEFRDDIAPGDIIFNAEQTRKLLKNGHVNSRGRALAGGTQTLSGFAFAGSTDSTNKTPWNKVGSNSLGGNTKSTEANTKATNANTGAKDKETAATENTVTALDKFNSWLSSLFDWIEVRIERITHRMELAISKAENIGGSQTYQGKRKEYVGQVGYIGKNAYISDAMDENKKLQRTNTRAVPIYEAQATKVAKRAQKAGLINKKQRKNLVRKIKNGAMSIQEFDAELKKNSKGKETSKSESKRKTFVDAYKQWYDKARQCEAAIQDCISKTKELEQTKLDNIVEEFESLANYADAVGKTSAALLSLNNTVGTVSYSKQNKNLYQDQINANRNMAGYYSQQMNAYQTEMANAAGIFGTNSNEYREAQAKFQEMNQALYEAQENAAKLTIELRKLDLKPVEYAMGRFEEFGKKLAGIVSLKEARGILFGREEETRINEDDYYKQIENNNDTIVELMEKVKIQQGWLDQGFYDQNGETIVLNPESDAYRELESQIAADNEQINQLLISNENLKKSIVTLRWEAFEDLQKKLNNATSDYEHLQGLINQEGLFDDNGKGWNLTDEGVANLTLIAAKMYTAEEQIKSYREALNRVQEEYENGNRSLEDYEETSRNHVETIQKLVDGNQNLKKSIIDTYKTQITNENNALVDLINKRKEAYDAKKKYYDYDKQLRQQNDDISKLRAQAAALQGVSNQASQARLARINDELAQKEKDMADSVAQHRYEVGSEGYSKLADSAQESLSNTLAMVASSSTQQEIIVQQMLANVSAQYESAYDLIQQKIDETGTIISNTAEKQMQVNGEVNNYLDLMTAKSDQLKIAWDNYVKLVIPSGQTMSEALTGFITLIDSGTRHPKENWEAFVEAVGGTISTAAFETFCKTISQGVATETEQWNAFKREIQGKIDETEMKKFLDFILDHLGENGTLTTSWDTFEKFITTGELDPTKLHDFFKVLTSEEEDNETKYKAFVDFIGGQTYEDENVKKFFDEIVAYVNPNGENTIITYWDSFASLVGEGMDSTKAMEFCTDLMNAIKSGEGSDSIYSKWGDVLNQFKSGIPEIDTSALTLVQQKMSSILSLWGKVVNQTTGESAEGVAKALTAISAPQAGQNVDTGTIQMDKTSSGQTVDQAAIDKENARKAAEEAARRAVEESNQRKAAKEAAKQAADTAYATYLGYAPQIQAVQDEVDKNKRNWDSWVAKMQNAKHDSKEWKDAAAKAKHHRLAYEEGNRQYDKLKADQAAWLAEYNRLQSYYESLPSYKVGTKRTLEDELALTHDKEIILGNGAVLRQLPQGSQVLPKIQADNIWKWSKIDPLKDMGKGIGATASVNTINNTGNNFYYDALIHIDGNVDADVMDRLEDFGKALINNRNFQKNLTNVVTKEFVREGRKLGYK